MANPQPHDSRRTFGWLLTTTAIIVLAVVWYLSSRVPEQQRTVQPDPEFTTAPPGPTVPVTLPNTAMTNAPTAPPSEGPQTPSTGSGAVPAR